MTTVLDGLTSANGILEGVEATLTPSGTRLTWNVYRPTGSLVGRYASQESALEAASADAIKRQQLGVYRVLPPTRLELNIVGFGVTSVPPPQASGDVWVEQISYSGLETRQVILSVRRGAASNGAIAVDWALTGFAEGTPSPASGTINWVAGETGIKNVTVTLGQVTANQVGAFTLSNARLVTGIGSLQPPRILTAEAAISIINDAIAPTAPTFGAAPNGQTAGIVNLVAPATDVGGLGVASYRVEYKRTVDATWTLLAAAATANQFPLAIPGLAAGTQYQVRGNAADAASPANVSAYSAIASFTTASASDTVPDAFSFVDQTGVAVSTLITSAPITVAGINAAAPISVSGGEYSINGGAFTSAPGTVTNGQQVRVRHTSSAANSAQVNTVLTIGGVSDTFTSTTQASSASVYPLYTSFDRNEIPWHIATGVAGPQVPLQATVPPNITGGQFTANSAAEVNTLSQTPGRRIVIGQNMGNVTVGGFQQTRSDVQIVLPPDVRIGTFRVEGNASRVAITGPTSGVYSGGSMAKYESGFGSVVQQDLLIDGVGISGTGGADGFIIQPHFGIDRMAILNARLKAGVAIAFMQDIRHLFMANISGIAGVNGPGITWGFRHDGQGPVVLVDVDLRTPFAPGVNAYHRFRSSPPVGTTNQKHVFIKNFVGVDSGQSTFLWANLIGSNGAGDRHASFIVRGARTYSAGAGGNGTIYPEAVSQYAEVTGGLYYGRPSVGDLASSESGSLAAVKNFGNNQHFPYEAPPAWINGDPTGLPMT